MTRFLVEGTVNVTFVVDAEDADEAAYLVENEPGEISPSDQEWDGPSVERVVSVSATATVHNPVPYSAPDERAKCGKCGHILSQHTNLWRRGPGSCDRHGCGCLKAVAA